ncbi:MAG: hypothetical protein WCV62_00850 [Candidatus Peribacteraceae bacterium]|jgi:hypothetical protein
MNSLVFGIIVSALLSTTSLLVVVFRVSPLTSPVQALTAFFAALFLSVSSVGALLFLALWRLIPLHTWDGGKVLGISVRQGILLALGTVALVGFHILGVLTWWIAVIIYLVFVLVEVALNA